MSAEERTVWACAHGVPDQLEAGRPWTREALLEAVRAHLPDADVATIIDDLLGRDVLAEVNPGTQQAIDFASKYRLIPLMLGLGNTPEEPWEYRIGLVSAPLVSVSGTVYHMWEWSHLYKSLWDSCRKLAKIREGHTDPPATAEQRDPEAILTEILGSLHHLLAPGCAYLDVPHDWGTP